MLTGHPHGCRCALHRTIPDTPTAPPGKRAVAFAVSRPEDYEREDALDQSAHRWRVEGGATASHGVSARCDVCGLRVVARVDALGPGLVPVLYHADAAGLAYVPLRDRCPGARP